MGSEVEVIVASSAIHHWSEYAVQVEVDALLCFGRDCGHAALTCLSKDRVRELQPSQT